MQPLCVNHQRTSIVAKVCVALDGLSANVAHGLSAWTCHLVAAFLFEEVLLACGAGANERLCHLLMHEIAPLHSCCILYFLATEWQVADTLALPAALLHAAWVLADENQELVIVDHHSKVTERTFLQVDDASSSQLCLLHSPLPQLELLSVHELLGLVLREHVFAPTLQARQPRLGPLHHHLRSVQGTIVAEGMSTSTARH
mmetsp:Transcript_19729/g.75649  ORF Transcript_19729/g.75649 Transcript_19729/m.75649 type:complete len:201 (+) Transcript_19729:264-866(+)